MAEGVYILCALTSALCAGLLWRSYRATRTQLLLWSALCFIGLTLNNALLFTDLVLVRSMDMSVLRNGTGIAALAVLVYGLITDSE
jgi:hypothetical protein